MKALQQPLHLFLTGEVAVVQEQGILGLSQRCYFAVRIYVVTLLHVFQDVGIFHRLSLGCKFQITPLGAHFGRGGDKDLQFGIGKDHCADITSIHHDALLAAHLLLLPRQRLAHKGKCRHRAYPRRHLHRADFLLDDFAVHTGQGQVALGVYLETDAQLGQSGSKSLLVHTSLGVNHSAAQGKECDHAIHGSRIYIYISHFARQALGHSALSAGGVSVYGYGNSFHIPYLFSVRNAAGKHLLKTIACVAHQRAAGEVILGIR